MGQSDVARAGEALPVPTSLAAGRCAQGNGGCVDSGASDGRSPFQNWIVADCAYASLSCAGFDPRGGASELRTAHLLRGPAGQAALRYQDVTFAVQKGPLEGGTVFERRSGNAGSDSRLAGARARCD